MLVRKLLVLPVKLPWSAPPVGKLAEEVEPTTSAVSSPPTAMALPWSAPLPPR
jgi:hypothetical protein